ncbi:Pigment-dispersing hormone [Trinorchestia longiramus]|nr:Pigment-dispersing hormone [Trinorchestia longiramus]
MLGKTVAVWSLAVLLSSVAAGEGETADVGAAILTVPERLAIMEWAMSIARVVDSGPDGQGGLLHRLELLQEQLEQGNWGSWRGSGRPSYVPSHSHDKRNSELINSLLGLPKFLRGPLNASKNHGRNNGQ